jgi:alkanesulfonate monooxygenase SsuD/methylene tetrahydromethanopterin reductase-like flavin-dependent oxidoreductase (luciferase family)
MSKMLYPQLTFGVFDHLDDTGGDHALQYANRLRLAEACDRAGFHAYHVAEHHGTPHGIAPSPNLFLSAVSQRTRRLRFGPMVMLLNLYHPLRAFEEVCMLDQMSGGRVEFGIGRGGVPIELSFFGVDMDQAQDRYLEAAHIILKAMSGGTLNHHGRYFELQDVPITLAPVQKPHPPIWYGTNSPETAAWAAVNRTNIASFGATSSIRAVTDAFRAQWERTEEQSFPMPLLGMTRHVVIADTEREANALAAPAYERWFETLTYLSRRQGISPAASLPASFSEAVENGLCLAGPVSAVRDAMLRQARDAGINYLLCHVAFGDLPLDMSLRTVAAIGAEIMPAFGRSFALGSGQMALST